jgi:DNA repair exonuclease SbcCD ATPase subunit
MNLNSTVLEIQGRVEYLRRRLADIESRKQALNKSCGALDVKIKVTQEALELARKCLEQSLKRRKYIERLISQALSEVYDLDYTFVLEVLVDGEGNIKGLKPRLSLDGGDFRDPVDCYGQGASDIINLVLSIICLGFVGGTQKILVMDEPLAHIGSEMQSRLNALLTRICQDLDLQLIMITHQNSPFGKVLRVKKNGGVSRVEEQ